MHIPVLQKEVIHYLDPKPNENFIDATIGQGGHTTAILQENGPNGKILGIELDPELYQELKLRMAKIPNPKSQIPKRLVLAQGSYANLKEIVKKCNFGPINGILFDLGMSSWHLEESGRGFSFQRNEPLDMRYNITHIQRPSYKCYVATAAEIINSWPKEEIKKILKEYGEEKFASRIAQQVVAARKRKPIKTTLQLVDIIKRAVPKKIQRGRIHPAARTFQALRIAVNNELENIKKALPQALERLEEKGRIVVISFHSLEDRLAKNFFRSENQKGLLKIITKKPVVPSLAEVQKNPRSRSAKLRAAIKK